MTNLYYCMKCKKKTAIKQEKQTVMKNGKPALRGECSVCGTTVCAILSAKKAEILV